MEDQIISILVGTAVGDTLGMAVEGWKQKQVEKYVGRITSPIDPVIIRNEKGQIITSDEFGALKYYTADLKKGEFTDDTVLSIALLEALLENGYDLALVGTKHVEKYLSMKAPDGHIRGGFGRTTTQAIELLLAGKSVFESGLIGGPGNGPAMKMAVLGAYMYITQTYDQGLQFAYDVGKITHLDPRSLASGVIQAHATYSLLSGCTKEHFLVSCYEICKTFEKIPDAAFANYNKGMIGPKLEWIIHNTDANVSTALDFIGNNSDVYKSYPFTLFMFQKYWDNPKEGLLSTINTGGDCDTTGAMFGALGGAKHGSFFENAWLDPLQDREKLINLGKKLYSLGEQHG